jgi:hypothetical protein
MSAVALGSLTRKLAHVSLSPPSMIACKVLAGSNVTQQLRFKTGGKGKRTIRVSLWTTEILPRRQFLLTYSILYIM